MAAPSKPRRSRTVPARPAPAPTVRPPLPLYKGPAHPEKLPNEPPAETEEEQAAREAWLDATAARFAEEGQGSTAWREELERQADASVADVQRWAGWRTVALHVKCRPGEYPITTTIRLEPMGGYAIMQRSQGVTRRLHSGFRDLSQVQRVFDAIVHEK